MKMNSLLNDLSFRQLLDLFSAFSKAEANAWSRVADLLVTQQEWSRVGHECATDEQVTVEAVKHHAAKRNSAAVLLRLQTEFESEWSEFATEWWNENHLQDLLDNAIQTC